MKTLVYYLLLTNVVLSSCATEKWFDIGISANTGFSRNAAKSFAQASEQTPYDVIIVPGIPYDPASVSSILRVRVLWAKYLYDNGFAKNIIFSGSAVYTPYIEAVAMKVIADSLGISIKHTFIESRAEHNTENVYNSLKMAKEMGLNELHSPLTHFNPSC